MSYCIVATRSSPHSAVDVSVVRGVIGQPTLFVTEVVASDALRLRPDLGRRVVEFIATLDGIGELALIGRAASSTESATNAGCLTYALQYVVGSDNRSAEAVGSEFSIDGTIIGESLSNWSLCDSLILEASSGNWAFVAA